MIRIKHISLEGERIPPFYYGAAYTDYASYHTVFYIMPFNYLVRWKRYIHHWWIRNIQRRESWFDYQIKKTMREEANRHRESYKTISIEANKYRLAYYECMQELYKTNVTEEVKQKLFDLG